MSPAAASDSIAHALQQLQKDSQQQQVITKHVKSIEAKLNALEGSVLTAGESSCIRLPFAACICIQNFCSLASFFGTKNLSCVSVLSPSSLLSSLSLNSHKHGCSLLI